MPLETIQREETASAAPSRNPTPVPKDKGKRRASASSPSAVKKVKLDQKAIEAAKHTVTNWKQFLPQALLGSVLACDDFEDWKRASRCLVSVLFFKIRGPLVAHRKSLGNAIIPPALRSKGVDLHAWLTFLLSELQSTIIHNHWIKTREALESYGEDNCARAREEARRNREVTHARNGDIAAFPTPESVQEVITLSFKDILSLWAPILRDIHPRYLNENESDNQSDNWLANLESSSYDILARFASGNLYAIPGSEYSPHSRAIDLRATSCVLTELAWPEVIIPEAWSDYPNDWGTLADIWPRHDDNVNRLEVLSDDEGGEGGGVGLDEEDINTVFPPVSRFPETGGPELPADVLERIETTHRADVEDTSKVINVLLTGKDMWKGFRFNFYPGNEAERSQLSEEYITQESSLIAQMSNSAQAIYLTEKFRQQKEQLVLVGTMIKRKEKCLDEDIAKLTQEAAESQCFADELQDTWASFRAKAKEREERVKGLARSKLASGNIHFQSGDDRLTQMVNPTPKRTPKRQAQPIGNIRLPEPSEQEAESQKPESPDYQKRFGVIPTEQATPDSDHQDENPGDSEGESCILLPQQDTLEA